MKSYSTARTLLGLIRLFGGLIVIVGFILLLQGARAGLFEALIVVLPTIFGGALLMALAEIGTAQLDTASNTATIADLLRRQSDGKRG